MAANTNSNFAGLSVPWFVIFIPVIMVLQMTFTALLYPYFTGQHVYDLIEKEKASYVRVFGRSIAETMTNNGDAIYNTLFVKSGIEQIAYRTFVGNADVLGSQKFQEVWFGGTILDNQFDFQLLLSYRLGFGAIFSIFAVVFLLTLFCHVIIDRKRRRYSFGDAPLLLNSYARGISLAAMPLSFIAFSLPLPIHPFMLMVCVASCAVSMCLVLVFLPKKM